MNIRISAYLIASTCFALSLMANSALAGSIYKWVDKDGVVHYGQLPEGENATELSRQNRPEAEQDSDSASDEQTAQPGDEVKNPNAQYDALRKENEMARAEIERQNAEIAKRNEEITKTNCTTAQKRLTSIQNGGRMYSVNDKGEREYWDDSRRNSEVQTAQDAIDKWCK